MFIKIQRFLPFASSFLPANPPCRVNLERFLSRPTEHFVLVNRGQPERRHLIVEVAVSVAVAFDHRVCTESLQTRAGRDQILAKSAVVIDR